MPSLIQTSFVLAFPVLVIVAALKDLTSYTIPNWISLALLAAFVPAALIVGAPLQVVGVHVAIALIALIAGMAMFALGWIGGGDAKLFAAAALWIGFPAITTFALVTCVGGGALAVSLLALRSPMFRPYVLSGPAWFGRLATPGENVPYGVAIAVGAMAAFADSTLVRALSQTS